MSAFVTKDEVPYISGSYAAQVSDPTGASGKAKAAPYNFFYGPSYSDALRAMLMWAADDWKAKGKTGKPKYVHMGGNHPYPNSPKEAGEAMAKDLGFEVLPAIVFAWRRRLHRHSASPPRMRGRTTPISAIPAARTSRF